MERSSVRDSAPPGHRPNRRQREVLFYISKGFHNRDIASALGLSERSVKHCVEQLLLIYGAANRTELTGMLLPEESRLPGEQSPDFGSPRA